MAWSTLSEARSAGQTGHLADHNQLHEWANNDFDINWGTCFVHPNGSNSYDGKNRRFPKATIQGAISAGFEYFFLGPGTHTLTSQTSWTSVPTLIAEPGPDPASTTGWALVTASSDVSSYFKLDKTATNNTLSGGYFEGVMFDADRITDSETSSALEFNNVNRPRIYHCSYLSPTGTQTASSLVRLYNGAGPSDPDGSWLRMRHNWVFYASLLRYTSTVNSGMNRYYIHNNICSDGDGTGVKTPFIDCHSGEPSQWIITGNSFTGIDASTSPSAAVYMNGQGYNVDACYIAENTYDDLSGGAYSVQLVNAANNYVEVRMGKGVASGSGHVRVASTSYSTQETGQLGHIDSRNNRIVINTRTVDW